MPKNILFDIAKEIFDQILTQQESNESKIKLTVSIDIIFSSKEELDSLKKFIQKNKKLEYLKLNLPGSFNFEEVLTEELIKEQVPNIKITIKETTSEQTTTTSFNEFS